MGKYLFCTFLLFFIVLQLNDGILGDDRNTIVEKLLKDGPNKWNFYLNNLPPLRVQVTFLSYENGKQTGISTSQYDILGTCYQSHMILDDGREQVICFGKEYSFEINKEKNESWRVEYITPRSKVDRLSFPTGYENSHRQSNDSATNITRYVGAGTLLYGSTFLPTLFSLSEFQITNAEKFFQNGEEKISFTFVFLPPEEKYPLLFRIEKGNVILDSTTLLIDEAEMLINNWGNRSTKYTYETTSPIPFLKTLEKIVSENITEKYDFQYFDANDINESCFTLSHYGLPEPDFGDRKTNRIRYIIMAVGLLMIGVGAWRMIQKRRENA